MFVTKFIVTIRGVFGIVAVHRPKIFSLFSFEATFLLFIQPVNPLANTNSVTSIMINCFFIFFASGFNVS